MPLIESSSPDLDRPKSRIGLFLNGAFLRFFVANLCGLLFDAMLAWAIVIWFGIPLIISAVISLLLTAVVMYFIHEFWTFRSTKNGFSAVRLAGTITSTILALGIRSSCLYITSVFMGFHDNWAVLQFLAASGFSFVGNYVVTRLVFARASRRQTSQHG